jgi:hypothetical protein
MKSNKSTYVTIIVTFSPSPLVVIDGHNVIHDNICKECDVRNCLECSKKYRQSNRKYWRLTSEIGRLEKCLKFYRDLGYEPFAWIKQSTYNTAKWYADDMDFAAVLKMIEAKELDIPRPDDDDIWWVTYALRQGGQIVTNDKFKDKYMYDEMGRKKKDGDGNFILKKQGERTKHPELPWDKANHGDESIDARTYGFEFIKRVGKEDEPQSFHSPISKFRGGVIPAESDPRDEEIANLRDKIRSLEKDNRSLITKLTTTMDMDFNGHENEIVDVWERALGNYQEVSCRELFLDISRKILHLKGLADTWTKSWEKDVRIELGYAKGKSQTTILEDMSIVLLETKGRNVKFDNERTSVMYLR